MNLFHFSLRRCEDRLDFGGTRFFYLASQSGNVELRRDARLDFQNHGRVLRHLLNEKFVTTNGITHVIYRCPDGRVHLGSIRPYDAVFAWDPWRI